MAWQAVGVERITPEAPADLSAWPSTTRAGQSFELEAQPCGAAAGFLHIGLTAQRSQNVGGDAGMVKVGFCRHPRFPPLSFFAARPCWWSAPEEADNRGHSQQHGDHDPNLGGGGGQGDAARAITAAHKIRANTKKAGDRQMRWNEFMLQSTSLGSVFLPLRQTRRRHL